MTVCRLDIAPSDLAIVHDILRRHLPDREIWVFGSRISGKARPYSDLDLCILGEHPVLLTDLAALSEAFSESDLPFKVDLIDWAVTGERFQAIIAAEKMVLRSGRRDGG